MTAGTWPALSSFFSSSSLSCLWLHWPCSMSYWTVGAVPKGRHISSYNRRGRETAASSWPAFARSRNPTPRWYRCSRDEDEEKRGFGFYCWTGAIPQQWPPKENWKLQNSRPTAPGWQSAEGQYDITEQCKKEGSCLSPVWSEWV